MARVATRDFGPDLLIAHPDPARPVERLTGSGPPLWRLFKAGASIEEAVERLAEEDGVAHAQVRQEALAFATLLVGRGLADPT